MDAFPAFFPLAGRKVIVAGEGEAYEARMRLFHGSPADVVRLDSARAREPDAYVGAALAFIAGGGDDFLKDAASAARAAGVPVNVADRPDLCDFTTPAVIDRGALVAAVGTAGAAPLLAAMLRNDIEARVPEGAGRVAALLGGLREEVRRALPDLARRRAFLRRAIDGPAAFAALAGDMDLARRLLKEALAASDHTAAGRITVIQGEGPADLLSLRAVRALGQADVVVAEDDGAPDVAALARRDARRLTPDEASEPVLRDLVGEGGQVVWLTTPTRRRRRLKMLADIGGDLVILASAAN